MSIYIGLCRYIFRTGPSSCAYAVKPNLLDTHGTLNTDPDADPDHGWDRSDLGQLGEGGEMHEEMSAW